jgi:phosphotransferase system enzyme I (PtsI)
MFDSFHPVVIKSIKRIIDAAHKNGIRVCMCGELAGDEKATVLLGLGLDEFSTPAGEAANIKSIIRNTSYEKAGICAKKACAADTAKEARECLESCRA